jgi:phenol/toluene 2-monooxygenase (NADH) P1/A1
MLTSFMPEWYDETVRWVDAVVKVAAAESPENKALIAGWAKTWGDRTVAALAPVAEIALGDQGQTALAAVRATYDARCKKAGLEA